MISPEDIRRDRDEARAAYALRNTLTRWAVTRPGPPVVDPVTGDTATSTVDVWEGGAGFSDKIRPHVRTQAGADLVIDQPTLSVPWDAPALQPGDAVHAVDVGDGGDPTLLERRFRIAGRPDQTQFGVQRRYPLEEVTQS